MQFILDPITPIVPPKPVLRAISVALALLVILPFSVRPASAQFGPPAGVQGATISSITDNPQQYYGQVVTVTGTLAEPLGLRSFLLQDDDLLSDDQLPVIASAQLRDRAGQPLEPGVLRNRGLLVTGTVHQFNLTAFENELGLDLDDEAWSEWAGRPAIIATSIRPAPWLDTGPF